MTTNPLEAIAEIIDSPGNSKDKAATILFSLAIEAGMDPESEADEIIRADMAEDEAAMLRVELMAAREKIITCQEGCAAVTRMYLRLTRRLVFLRPGDGRTFDRFAEHAKALATQIAGNRAAFRAEYGRDVGKGA
jgi:hypothetical protein